MMPPHTEPFVPLSFAGQKTAPRKEGHVTVVNQPANAKAFQPLETSAQAAVAAAHGQNCQPRVSVQREGDRVSLISVHCSCGQVIELACEYPA
jgi:hypothetical protein